MRSKFDTSRVRKEWVLLVNRPSGRVITNGDALHRGLVETFRQYDDVAVYPKTFNLDDNMRQWAAVLRETRVLIALTGQHDVHALFMRPGSVYFQLEPKGNFLWGQGSYNILAKLNFQITGQWTEGSDAPCVQRWHDDHTPVTVVVSEVLDQVGQLYHRSTSERASWYDQALRSIQGAW